MKHIFLMRTVPALVYVRLYVGEEVVVFSLEVLYRKPELAVSFLEDTTAQEKYNEHEIKTTHQLILTKVHIKFEYF